MFLPVYALLDFSKTKDGKDLIFVLFFSVVFGRAGKLPVPQIKHLNMSPSPLQSKAFCTCLKKRVYELSSRDFIETDPVRKKERKQTIPGTETVYRVTGRCIVMHFFIHCTVNVFLFYFNKIQGSQSSSFPKYEMIVSLLFFFFLYLSIE